MSHKCPKCGDLKTSGECDNCGYDPAFDEGDRDLSFDGGAVLTKDQHLAAALDQAEAEPVRYHIRAAMQYRAFIRGEVDFRGNYSPFQGGPSS